MLTEGLESDAGSTLLLLALAPKSTWLLLTTGVCCSEAAEAEDSGDEIVDWSGKSVGEEFWAGVGGGGGGEVGADDDGGGGGGGGAADDDDDEEEEGGGGGGGGGGLLLEEKLLNISMCAGSAPFELNLVRLDTEIKRLLKENTIWLSLKFDENWKGAKESKRGASR